MRIVLLRSTAVMPDPPVEKMANTLIELGHEARIVAWDRNDTYREKTSRKHLPRTEADIIHFGIPAEYSGGLKKNFRALLLFQIRIIRWLIRHRKEYDVVHAFDFDTGFAAKLCSKIFRKKFVYHILDYYVDAHRLPGRTLNSIIEFFEIRVINAADVTIICTEKRLEQIAKASPKKVYVIHNTPTSTPQNAEAFAIQGNHSNVKIAYIGILSKMRLLKETVTAVSQMKDIEMHIGGFGEYEEWMRDAAARYDNIFFYGKLQYSQTLALENQCDIMVAAYDPSIRNHKYAAPNKFYESLMLGKPIIMAKGTGYDDVITENDIGFLAEYSEEGISNAIHALERRRSDWKSMGERAKQLYCTTYTWTIMQQRIKEIYDHL